MCLIMTAITAIVFTASFFVNKKKGNVNKSVFMAMLMFWAASLMWSIDGVASVLGGEGFFDLSIEDTILGAIILISGLLVFAAHSLLQKRKPA
ncbi:hypothetical protein SAMN04487977_11239 [Treponema bryantii]|uniref:Uncharacterized protein n=1 Tax=Treponema bryantii TaxID=163 RepID=A0A1H9JCZ0_9SPIR|nr:hypothetical protein [Treponema bryantii]SEQ84702.1 hypothetical protein SAMN04487977_11239 [Treponema bryantii]